MTQFNPLFTSEELKELYKNYILSTFPLKNETIRSNLEKIIDSEKVLWNGPFVSLTSKYKRGGDAQDFLEQCGFKQSVCKSIKLDRFYKHQEDTIRLIQQQNHAIVSTGTGSGKTEAFLLPIFDYCLKNREKGIKAIIVYPMNALANDQMLRLRTFLSAINANLDDPITFARYTGQTPHDNSEQALRYVNERCRLDTDIIDTSTFSECPRDCNKQQLYPKIIGDTARLTCSSNLKYLNSFEVLTRKEISQSPPDILITNYVQLEYLLLRREDAPIFRSPYFRFLVFDEIHYYAGATGAEVALLIRRLKARLAEYAKQEILCIGTSATISSTDQAKQDIAQFATQLFGDSIQAHNVVIGETEAFDFKDIENPLGSLDSPTSALLSTEQIITLGENEFVDLCYQLAKEQPSDILRGEQRLAFLGTILSRNGTFGSIARLIQDQPKSVEEICQELSASAETTTESAQNELEQLIWLYLYYGSISYDPESFQKNIKEPLIRPQIHLFLKTLGDRWPISGLFVCAKCLALYTTPYDECKSCGGIVEELGACRSCGAEFYRSTFQGNPADKSVNATSTIGKQGEASFRHLSYDDDGFKTWQTIENPSGISYLEYKKCLGCGSLNSKNSDACQFCYSHDLRVAFVNDRVNKCPFCGNYYIPGHDIVTPIYVSPNVTSRLVFDLNHSLLPKELQKMIVFTDSRQDASYMAGTIGEEHLTHLLRQIITKIVRQFDDISLDRLTTAVLHEIQLIDPLYKGDDIKERLLKEIGSVVGKRRSVENLGLVACDYVGIWSVDSSSISSKFNISDDILKRYIVTVLNEMRQDRALEGLHYNMHGRLPPQGFVCEHGPRKLHYVNNLIKTRGRYAQYTRKVFPEADALAIIEAVFDFLKQYEYLKEVQVKSAPYSKNSENGYVIAQDKITLKKPHELYVCDTCEQVHTAAPNESCTTWNCNGHLQQIVADDYYRSGKKFYTSFYKDRVPSRLKVKEDTGYLSTDVRQKLELAFRAGDVDMLVATPTLELGIDIGDITSIGLMKAPPSAAKYVQRVGRAGRVSRISMASAFMFQNPIDLYYFSSPLELINGRITAPAIHVENKYIVNRHVHSLILEEILVRPTSVPPYYKRRMLDFALDEEQEALLQAVSKAQKTLINKIKSTFEDLDIDSEELVTNFLVSFPTTIDAYNYERALLREILDDIRHRKDEIWDRRDRASSSKQERKRLDQMERNIQARHEDLKDYGFFSYLSKTGVLPRYAFPGRAVRILSDDGQEYQERQMPVALYELALGKALYLNGRKKRVIGIPFGQDPEMLKSTEFFVCKKCKTYAKESRPFSTCPECGAHDSAERVADCYRPTSVVVRDEGIPKETGREMAIANLKHYLLEPITEHDILQDKHTRKTEFGVITLIGKRQILTLLCSLQKYDDMTPQRFTVCGQCGYHLGGNFTQIHENKTQSHRDLLGKGRHEPPTVLSDIKLYHTFDTATLVISQLPSNDTTFITTLKNGLINAAQRIVGAEDGEIEGIIKDDTLILYDNIEGAAGYVNLIFDKFDDVFSELKSVVLNCDCEHGCLKCLYSYRRRGDIAHIDKQVLLELIRPIQRKEVEESINLKARTPLDIVAQDYYVEPFSKRFNLSSDVQCVLSGNGALDGALELRDFLLTAKKDVSIVSLYVSDRPVMWENNKSFSWCDILITCKIHGVESIKVIVRAPKDQWQRYSLEKLQRRGIDVYIFDGKEGHGIAHNKIVLIDSDAPESVAVLQSANLSPEAVNNSDFFIFLTKKQNERAHKDIEDWVDSLVKQSVRWSDFSS